MTIPEDAGAVLTAIKLGWCLAEVRGRNRPDAPPGAKAGLPGPPSHALPLRVEQTPAEQRIEAQAVLAVLARKLHVDRAEGQRDFARAIDDRAQKLAEARKAAAAAQGAAPAAGLPAAGSPATAGETAAPGAEVPAVRAEVPAAGVEAEVAGAGVEVPAAGVEAEAPGDGGEAPDAGAAAPGGGAGTSGVAEPSNVAGTPSAAGVPDAAVTPGGMAISDAAADDPAVITNPDVQWDALQELIFKFDQHIQDTLASGADTISCGYQLGRALAEPYWALDPTLPNGTPSPTAWWFLFGAERCGEMGQLIGRLSAYFHPYTAAAIAGSVQVWKHVAADQDWRVHARDPLYQQIRRWYELVIMHQDPTTLVQPYALIRNFRMVRRALRIFWPELSGTVIAAAALSFFAVLIGQHNINSFVKGLLGFIAITGFSISGLAARLKNQAQAMVTRLRQDVYTDLVAVAITTAPKVPSVPDKPAKQNARLAQMVRERTITPETPN